MAILQIVKESPHYYSRKGVPMHDSDLRMARKLKLLPSVTTVLNVWPKPALENYKMEQAILAALTLPRRDLSETSDEYAKRVVVDMDEHRTQAAVFGRTLHSICEQIALERGTSDDLIGSPYHAHALAFEEWQRENILEVFSAETVVVSKLGYAGTYDLIARTRDWGVAMIDYKSQGVKETPKFYDTWGFQLESYLRGVHEVLPRLIDNRVSVIIDSTQGRASTPIPQVWHTDPDKDFECFTTCLKLWRLFKKFPYETV